MDTFTLASNFEVQSSKGPIIVSKMYIYSEGYIPDLYIEVKEENRALWNDKVFIDSIMRYLKHLGFSGKPFGRAELGMQDDNCIVLEPNKEFQIWLTINHGWIYLGDEDE